MTQSSEKSVRDAETQSNREAALRSAVQLLKPFPWKPVRRVRYYFEYPQDDFFCWTSDDAWEHCEAIAHGYASMLRAENKSIRPSVLRNELSDLVRSCRNLSQQISGLSDEAVAFIQGELYFSQSRTAIIPEDDLESDLRNWPVWYRAKPKENVAASLAFNYDETINNSALVTTLVGLTEHTDQLLRVSKSDFRLAERKDRGGKSSVFTALHCSPRWYVVRQCWTLFASSSHLRPSTSSDGKLEQFIGAIHEHATGKTLGKNSLVTSLKEYRRVIMTMSSAQKALIALLRKNGARTKGDIEDHWHIWHIEQMFRDSVHLERAKALYDQHKVARLTLEFGPQLVGLHTKSGAERAL